MTLPAPTDYLSRAVAACGLPNLHVQYEDALHEWWVWDDEEPATAEWYENIYYTPAEATRAYTALRDFMLAKTGRVVDLKGV